MPRRRTIRKSSKKRRYPRRKASVPYLITSNILPRRSVMAVHKYTDTMYYNADLVDSMSFVFRANSVFDPDQSITTLLGNRNQQPRYRDQLAALYGSYRVLKAHMKVTVANGGVVAGDDVNFILYKVNPNQNDSIVTSTAGVLMEHPGRLGGGMLGLGRGGFAQKSASGWWSEKELTRLDRLNNESLAGTNPTPNPNFRCAIVGGASGDDVDNVSVRVEITYYTLWTQPQYADVS